MSRRSAAAARKAAPVFAALGDTTRLELVSRLGDGRQHSIARLAEGLDISRQGITKHLHVLEEAGVVSSRRVGRETRYMIRPARLNEAQAYLARASAQWDEAIARLKARVED